MLANQDINFSIIVACRNEAGHIRSFLDSLLSQDAAKLKWEAIIADGMSQDGTRTIVEQCAAGHPQIRLIDNPGRIVSTGLNAAIRAAHGDTIIRMDAHTVYAENYCRVCVETLERTHADNVGGPARTMAVGPQARAVAAAYRSRFSTGGAKFHDERYEGWVDTLPYGCWRKQRLIELGLFDEALVRNQDDELNLRITRAGGKIWQNPAIVSWYSPRPTLSSLFRQYFQYGFWKVAVIRKHHLPASWRHVVPILFILENLVLLACMLVARAAGAPQLFATSALMWLIVAVAYLVTIVAASLTTAHRSEWGTLPYLPAVFAAYHFSYGLGFLAGLRWYLPWTSSAPIKASLFTRISR